MIYCAEINPVSPIFDKMRKEAGAVGKVKDDLIKDIYQLCTIINNKVIDRDITIALSTKDHHLCVIQSEDTVYRFHTFLECYAFLNGVALMTGLDD